MRSKYILLPAILVGAISWVIVFGFRTEYEIGKTDVLVKDGIYRITALNKYYLERRSNIKNEFVNGISHQMAKIAFHKYYVNEKWYYKNLKLDMSSVLNGVDDVEGVPPEISRLVDYFVYSDSLIDSLLGKLDVYRDIQDSLFDELISESGADLTDLKKELANASADYNRAVKEYEVARAKMYKGFVMEFNK